MSLAVYISAVVLGHAVLRTSSAEPFLAPRASFGAVNRQRITGCIDTTTDYETAWQNGNVRCVSTNLIGTFHTQSSINKSHSWGYTNSFRFVLSNYDLERVLLLKKMYGNCSNPNKLFLAIAQTVGYGGNPSDWLGSYFLVVGDAKEHQLTPFVPTIESFNEALGYLGHYIPFKAQRDLSVIYSKFTDDGNHIQGGSGTPVAAASEATGCDFEYMTQTGNSPTTPDALKGCNQDYMDVLKATYNITSGDQTAYGTDCIDNVFNLFHQGGSWDLSRFTSAHLRALLGLCFAANPYWTSNGLGWSPWASPDSCDTLENQMKDGFARYSGAELIYWSHTEVPISGSDKSFPIEADASQAVDFVSTQFCTGGGDLDQKTPGSSDVCG
jgi:hypothetical protein